MIQLNSKLSLKEYFEHVLSRSLNVSWVNQPKFQYELNYSTCSDNLSGDLKIYGKGKKTGDTVLLMDSIFQQLSNKILIDDWIAEQLSTMLMNHTIWPR